MVALSVLGLYGLVGYSVIVGSLLVVGRAVPASNFFAKLIISWTCLCLCAGYGVAASLVLRLAGLGGLSQWTTGRAFNWVMYYAIGVEFKIENPENLLVRPAVYISNHQSELDVLMLGAMFPKYCSVTAKKSLKMIPFLGWFMALSKTIFIDRANRTIARQAFDGAAQVMRKDRQSVFIFPEGTRSYTKKPEMLPFKKGAFHLAVNAQVPIVPVVVANYAHVLHVPSWRFHAGNVPVRALKPVPTAGLTAADIDDLAHRVRAIMDKELISLTKENDSARLTTGNGSATGKLGGKHGMADEI